jgi:hypothetical protein
VSEFILVLKKKVSDQQKCTSFYLIASFSGHVGATERCTVAKSSDDAKIFLEIEKMLKLSRGKIYISKILFDNFRLS